MTDLRFHRFLPTNGGDGRHIVCLTWGEPPAAVAGKVRRVRALVRGGAGAAAPAVKEAAS